MKSESRTVFSERSCSWCHEINRIDPNADRVFCRSCGHRSDVARIDCDCVECETGRRRYEAVQREAEKR